MSPVNLEDVHPDNMKLFKKINKVCGLNLNGIDYITPSLSIPYHKYGSVIENNARPGVKGHYLMNPDSIDKFVKLIRFGKKTREGVVFNADYLHPYYDKYGISIDTKTKTLQKLRDEKSNHSHSKQRCYYPPYICCARHCAGVSMYLFRFDLLNTNDAVNEVRCAFPRLRMQKSGGRCKNHRPT